MEPNNIEITKSESVLTSPKNATKEEFDKLVKIQEERYDCLTKKYEQIINRILYLDDKIDKLEKAAAYVAMFSGIASIVCILSFCKFLGVI